MTVTVYLPSAPVLQFALGFLGIAVIIAIIRGILDIIP